MWLSGLSMLAGLALINAPAHAQEQGPAELPRNTTVFEMFFWSSNLLGLVITWVLIALSIVVLALLIHFLIQSRREEILPQQLRNSLRDLIDQRRFREAIDRASREHSALGQIVYASLSESVNGFAAMERAIEEMADLLLTRRIRSLEYLNVIGAVGPMLGLFGTVYGMIEAFNTIRARGNPSPEDLAGGISTALVTTFWGLVVGIPAVAAYALLRNRLEALVTEAMVEADALVNRVRQVLARSSAQPAAAPAQPNTQGSTVHATAPVPGAATTGTPVAPPPTTPPTASTPSPSPTPPPSTPPQQS
jgi:biopolymer transport protein ExbB